MDENQQKKNLNKTIFDLLMQHSCGHCLVCLDSTGSQLEMLTLIVFQFCIEMLRLTLVQRDKNVCVTPWIIARGCSILAG